MKGLDLLESEQWSLAPLFGFEHPFLTLNQPTIVNTWLALLLMFIVALPVSWFLKRKDSILRQLILTFVQSFIDMTTQALGTFSFMHFSFIATLFCFIFICNTLSIIPGLEEPTTDLNTTLSLGIIGFLYIQVMSINTSGFWQYIKSYFSPFFIMFPLNIISKVASIISISFRLFGNIFGGSIITHLYFNAIQSSIIGQILGLLLGINLIIVFFFGLFEGFLQAFVFTTLTLTYLAMSLQGEGH
jgi:F-type H+-transporting ATPase subunit a